MLVIHLEERIDCGVCEPECSVDSIKPDTVPGNGTWLDLNAKFSELWPVITKKSDPPPDHEEWAEKTGKLSELSEHPASQT